MNQEARTRTRTRSILRLCLALALLTVLTTMTQQETSQASDMTPNDIECPSGMTAYWKLDETVGEVYDDYYDWHDGYCGDPGCPTAVADGVVGGAQRFNRTTKPQINISAHNVFNWGNDASFSIEFWMRTPEASTCEGTQVVIGRDADDTESLLHWWAGCAPGGTAYSAFRDTDGVVGELPGTTDVSDGEWHHIAVVRLAGTGRLRLYVDGVEEYMVQVANTGDFGSPTAPITIGWLNLRQWQTYNFDGDVDEVAIYYRALTAAEILDHATSKDSYCLSANIDLSKTPSLTTVHVDDTVVYTYVATNNGNENLTQVNLTDDKCSPISVPSGDINSNSNLDIGETWTYTCSQVLNETTTNTATVTAVGTSGVQVSDTAQATVTVIDSDITLTKTAAPSVAYVNDQVIYTYVVNHNGVGAMSDPSIDDDMCSPISDPSGDTNANDLLDPGETWTYTCSQSLTQDTTNTATFMATDPAGDPVVKTATASVNVISPGMNLTKLAEEYALHNQPFTYRYELANTGDDPLSSVSVGDDKCTPVNRTGGDGNGDGKLDPGETWTYSCTKTMTQVGPETNIATATATDSKGQTLTDNASATVEVIESGYRYKLYLPCIMNDK